jgi:hypothetical protein
MKFRIPEIFLGAFLAVAIFAMGYVIALSNHPDTPQQNYTAQTAETKSQKDLTDARLADYTFLLALFTGLLAASTIGLWIVTNKAAEAAKAAKAYLICTGTNTHGQEVSIQPNTIIGAADCAQLPAH